jgi:hydroxymethylglutaryl-CoA reductase
VNGRDVVVPMVSEEPSVVAGASFMAKLARTGGGIATVTGRLRVRVGMEHVVTGGDIASASGNGTCCDWKIVTGRL